MDEYLQNIFRRSLSGQMSVFQSPVRGGMPLGIERVSNPQLGLGGAYGSWGLCYDNDALPAWIEQHLGEPLLPEERMDLASMGFLYRHHTYDLSPDEYVKTEVQVGAHFLREATNACGWEPGEVQAVLIGVSGPIIPDYTERIAKEAGIPENALKVSVHKACDVCRRLAPGIESGHWVHGENKAKPGPRIARQKGSGGRYRRIEPLHWLIIR
jgi:hypothetical protein